MRKYLIVRYMIIMAFLTGGLISCSTDDDSGPPPETSLADIIAESPNLTRLDEALDRAGLRTMLEGSGSFTVLAPTDAAFDLFLATANFPSIQDVPEDVLEQLILNHLIGAPINANTLAALGKNYTETLADGPEADTNLALFFDATGGEIIFNGKSEMVDADIAANNGLLHVVDTVIDFPTLATFIQANDGFEELNLAMTTATPGTDFIATLSGSVPYTLFAPPNVAFEDLYDTNPDWDGAEDIEESYLTAILQHHIIDGNVLSSEISDDMTATTLEGDEIIFSTADGGIDITDGAGNAGIMVVIANIQAINGVLHVLDEVLLPDTTN